MTQAVGLINHCWLAVLSEAALKERVGLRYLSHMWDHHPYWYLWFEGRAGVYKLELHGASTWEGYDWLAELVIKYYPGETEPCFSGLSLMERICRASEMFPASPPEGRGGCPCHGITHHETDKFADLAHGTGVPSYKFNEIIPADFFYAGHLLLAFNARLGSLIRLKSQKRWQVIVTEDHRIADERGAPLTVLKKGDLDRNFPGFSLSHFLYQRFLRSWILFHKFPAIKELVWQGEGIKFTRDGHTLLAEPSRDLQVVAQAELKHRPEDILAPVAVDELAKLHLVTAEKETEP